MNDKEFQSAKLRVGTLFKKWIKDLGLGWYQIDINYKMGDAPDRGDGYICCMNVVSRWMYRTATINVWIEEVPEDDWKLEKMVVHELCHILVEPMREPETGANDLEEMVVEGLARSFLWAEQGAIIRNKKGDEYVKKSIKKRKNRNKITKK